MTSTTTETERGLCAVCLTPVSKCDGKTCQHVPTGNAENLSRATVARPTDRQLALAADELSMEGSSSDERGLALYAAGAWLRTLVPSEVVAQLDAEIGDGQAWEEPAPTVVVMTTVEGTCPPHAGVCNPVAKVSAALYGCTDLMAAMGKHVARQRWIDAHGPARKPLPLEPDRDAYHQLAASISGVTGLSDEELHTWIDDSDRELFDYAYKLELDVLRRRDAPGAKPVAAITTENDGPTPSFENVQEVAAEAAKTAARDAMARGADPLVVVDLALSEIARFRQATGLSAQYVAQDPLEALVVELRHKRVPAPFARVVGALAQASRTDAAEKDGYNDGHERRHGDWSLLMLLDLVELSAMEGSREEITEKAIEEAGNFAYMLPAWLEAICEELHGICDHDDPEIRAAIDSAADEFIAGLTKAAQ